MDTVTPVEQQPLARGNLPADAPLAPWAQVCLNCEAPLNGPFCSECGQRAVPPHPRVSELAGDAFAEFSGWDGKFADTIRLLITRPGELTRQFIAGRRVRFISPVRLYLTMSFIYFVLAGAAASRSTQPGIVVAPGIQISTSATTDQNTAPAGASRAVVAARRGTLTTAERDSALAQVAHAPRVIRPLLRRGIEDPTGLKEAIVTNLPRVFFALLPVFAAILALFYRQRHYPEHLYFAIHLHAFAFLALSVVELDRLARFSRLAEVLGPVVLLWISAYTVLALRRVYGGSIGATLSKCVGIGMLYALASGVAMLALVLVAAVES